METVTALLGTITTWAMSLNLPTSRDVLLNGSD